MCLFKKSFLRKQYLSSKPPSSLAVRAWLGRFGDRAPVNLGVGIRKWLRLNQRWARSLLPGSNLTLGAGGFVWGAFGRRTWRECWEYPAYWKGFLAWVVWHLLTLSVAGNGNSLIEGHDAVLFTRKSSPENKNRGWDQRCKGTRLMERSLLKQGLWLWLKKWVNTIISRVIVSSFSIFLSHWVNSYPLECSVGIRQITPG